MLGENAIQGYWRVFGGLWQLVRSTYFWVALIIPVALPKIPSHLEVNGDPTWVGLTLSIVPCVLGFALGGMAIMLSFSSGRFLEAIRQNGKDKSYLMKMMASFFHFCIVLTASLVAAFISKFYPHKYLSFAGVFLSLYGMLLIIATASRIWHTARIFNYVSESQQMPSQTKILRSSSTGVTLTEVTLVNNGAAVDVMYVVTSQRTPEIWSSHSMTEADEQYFDELNRVSS